jgi:hypothetical protein
MVMSKCFFSLLITLSVNARLFSQCEIKFEKTVFDWGEVAYDARLEREFVFTNTSEAPVIISRASASSGAAIAYPPKDPVKPGESAIIRFKYDTKREGRHLSTIFVSYACGGGGEGEITLTIKGNVLPEKKGD